MHPSLHVVIFVPLLLALVACERFSSSANPSARAGVVRPASEKAIYLAMGKGLMGERFDALPRASRRLAVAAEYRALEYGRNGQVISWQGESKGKGENAGDFGEVTAGQPYQVGAQNCRQYRHDFTINGVTHPASGSACRNEDGSWSPL